MTVDIIDIMGSVTVTITDDQIISEFALLNDDGTPIRNDDGSEILTQ